MTRANRRGGNKLKYQVTQAIKRINFIGQSKREYRIEGIETGIHSTSQVKHVLSVGQNFADWAKERGIKDLYQLKRAHYRDYIAEKQAEGVSNGHLINIETNLRLLSKGMDQISMDRGSSVRDWVPKTRLIDTDMREQPRDRSMTVEQLDSAFNRLSDNAKIGAELQLAFGLRLREMSRTRVAHVVEKDGRLYWEASSDKNALNAAQGVTKGGRGRLTPCRPEYEQRVRELIQGKEQSDYVVPVRYNTLKSAYERAKIGGSHAFRHTYARGMLDLEFQKRGLQSVGPEFLKRMLENRELGFRRDKGFSGSEREVYKEITRSIDAVQSFLGHGDGRMDLVEVYLK